MAESACTYCYARVQCSSHMCVLVIWPSLGPFICNVFDFFLFIQFLLSVFALVQYSVS